MKSSKAKIITLLFIGSLLQVTAFAFLHHPETQQEIIYKQLCLMPALIVMMVPIVFVNIVHQLPLESRFLYSFMSGIITFINLIIGYFIVGPILL